MLLRGIETVLTPSLMARNRLTAAGVPSALLRRISRDSAWPACVPGPLISPTLLLAIASTELLRVCSLSSSMAVDSEETIGPSSISPIRPGDSVLTGVVTSLTGSPSTLSPPPVRFLPGADWVRRLMNLIESGTASLEASRLAVPGVDVRCTGGDAAVSTKSMPFTFSSSTD